MRKITGAVFVSLDGVMQAPGGPNEDPTGDFKLGGWLPQYYDEAVGKRVDALFDREFDLLLVALTTSSRPIGACGRQGKSAR